nr:MAG TPA: hypothetical protein [Inoviridae sp.]DAV16771.1 MAG TPA: hypothetical protein [Inoviridae sp.]
MKSKRREFPHPVAAFYRVDYAFGLHQHGKKQLNQLEPTIPPLC